MKYFFLAIAIFITIFSYETVTISQVDGKLLHGKWRSLEDKMYSMVVLDSSINEYYDKEKVSSFYYKVDSGRLIKTDKESGEVFNYEIVSVTKQALTLTYLERGNTLKFIKVK